jgi:hypothetical protein
MSTIVGLDLGGTNIKAVALGHGPDGPFVDEATTTPTLGHLGPSPSLLASSTQRVALARRREPLQRLSV